MKRVFGMVSTRGSIEYTPVALRTFFAHTPITQGDRFILIDNDGSLSEDSIKNEFPTIEFVLNEMPRSFAENANTVMEQAEREEAEFVFLNNDIVFTPGWSETIFPGVPSIVIPLSNLNLGYETAGFKTKPTMQLSDYLGCERQLEALALRHRQRHRGYKATLFAGFFCIRIHPEVYKSVGRFDTSFGVGGGEDGDYALRTALQGYPLLIALDSWILHFVGRSTWSGVESEEQTNRRNEIYRKAFVKKWGEALAQLIIHQNDSFIRFSGELSGIAGQAAWKSLVQRLGGNRVPPGAQWKPKVAAVCCAYEDWRWLAPSVASVYAQVDAVFFLVSSKPWFGTPQDNEQLLKTIQGLPDPDGKIRLFHGDWTTEEEQRNAGLKLLGDEHFDYCLVLDSDEIYEPSQLKAMIEFASQRRHIKSWSVGLLTYWKSERFRIDPPEQLRPPFLVKVGAASFAFRRTLVEKDQTAHIPEGIGVCHHMSYARTDQELLRKITTFSHANEIIPGWFEEVWKAWDANPGMENLHPTLPVAYKKAVAVPKRALPSVLW